MDLRPASNRFRQLPLDVLDLGKQAHRIEVVGDLAQDRGYVVFRFSDPAELDQHLRTQQLVFELRSHMQSLPWGADIASRAAESSSVGGCHAQRAPDTQQSIDVE